MNVSIPVYIEKWRGTHSIRPLFHPRPLELNRDLSRGLSSFVNSLRKELTALGREDDHGELCRRLFCPTIEQRRVKLELQLKRQTFRLPLILALFRELGRRVALSPQVPEVWFAVDRGEEIGRRAEEVYLEHFRALEADEGALEAEDYHASGKGWITTVEVDFTPSRPMQREGQLSFAVLGGAQKLHGAAELEEVGRCLDWRSPDELDRAFERERELGELTRALASTPPQPVVVVGPRQVGKTALIHEWVRQTRDERGGGSSSKQRCWRLTPGRLIAGMSYVGQWEQRVLAILTEARKKRHLLYFDDLLGLFRAGRSSGSALSVGEVLLPWLERREVRLLGEMTPEGFNLLKEVHRGFADLLHPIRLAEPSADETLLVLIRLVRELEGRHQCRFHPSALPRAIELQRRHGRAHAFPGKAADFLERLAIKHPKAEVDADEVLAEFHRSSGLSRAFLDDDVGLNRGELIEQLERQVLGQRAAVEALADVVSIGKARLQDPSRPLASCLFLGPTGVGKTEAAKALARVLLGSDGRLIRFDMNEYGDLSGAARLVGTFDRPAGQLTAAVRQSPFAVVLLDEIEKGHPAVFDLLLQVLDDGRLTDAGGETADFTGAILILTSNLGAREVGQSIGFEERSAEDELVYRRAAERFFRPEFFNRLDRVVPFQRLDRATIDAIAEGVLTRVLSREGLRRRTSLLEIEPAALERVSRLGFHPRLGARALKREVERQLARPVATRLSTLDPDSPTIINVGAVGDEDFRITVTALDDAPAAPAPPELPLDQPAGLLERMEELSRDLDQQLEPFRPPDELPPDRLEVGHRVYFALREQLRALRARADELAQQQGELDPEALQRVTLREASKRWLDRWSLDSDWDDRRSALELREALLDLIRQARPIGSDREEQLLRLARRLAVLEAMIAAGPERADERAMLTAAVLNPDLDPDGAPAPHWIGASLFAGLALEEEEEESQGSRQLPAGPTGRRVYRGPLARQVLEHEAGAHLFWRRDGSFALVIAEAIGLGDEDDAAEVEGRWRAGLEALLRGGSGDGAPSIIRYIEGETLLDVATGLAVRRGRSGELLQWRWPLPDRLLGDGR